MAKALIDLVTISSGRAAMAATCVLLATVPTLALAAEDHFEVWLNPSAATDLSERTELELDTAQRFRSRADGGRDTYHFRLWVNHKATKNLTLSGGIEQNWNDSQQERRLLQQAAYRSGVLRGRTRLEQRFVEGSDRPGIRVRQRVGVDVPLSADGKWSGEANIEGFLTLRSGTRGGADGLTGIRTIVGVAREVSDDLSVSLGYLRQQDVRRGRADRVGHAPLVGLELSF